MTTPSKRAALTPRDVKHIFEETAGGPQLLEHLVLKFGGKTFVKGGHEAERETCFREGQRAVVDYLVTLLARANNIPTEINENE